MVARTVSGRRHSARPHRARVACDSGWKLRTVRIGKACSLAGLARDLVRDGRSLCWLDSSAGAPGRGRFSALCLAGENALALGRSCRRRDAEPALVARLRARFERHRAPLLRLRNQWPEVPFLGGWVGYVAYEAQIDFDAAFPDRGQTLPYPRLWFQTARRGVTVRHDADETILWDWAPADCSDDSLDAWVRPLSEPAADPQVPRGWSIASKGISEDASLGAPHSYNDRWYQECVVNILERIRAGEVYQVNLTGSVPVSIGRDPLSLYLRLRSASPGDFSAFLRWPGLTVCASSPEEFLSLRAGRVIARPMKGTRPRGDDRVADDALVRELRHADKDRAENLMIVDLTRNDLGRVARVGSVFASRLFEVETYATVHQMTSQVEAELAPGEDVFSLLRALFPPGSMTGAPKVQATRVIRALEPVPRGVYSGCLGAIDWSGDAVFNVVIRSLVATLTGCSWAVGGGIVADSEPLAEAREARLKLSALTRALAPEVAPARRSELCE